MLPKSSEIEAAILKTVLSSGGEATDTQIRDGLTKQFPEVLDGLSERDEKGDVAWYKRIRGVKWNLKIKGDLEKATDEKFRLTLRGRKRAGDPRTEPASLPTLNELLESHEATIREKLRDRLLEMTPKQFEHFARKLLIAFGFVEVTVTGKAGDGGIDGYGEFRFGLSRTVAGFQCKRYKRNVEVDHIRNFRGSMDGRCHHGFFFTTSDFTRPAKAEAERGIAKPIALFNGEGIVRVMIERGVGVRRTPLYVYDISEEDLLSIGD